MKITENQRIEERAQAIHTKPQTQEAFTQTKSLVRECTPLSSRYIRLREISDKLSDVITPHTPCKKGCARCCYQAVAVSEHEANIIGRYTHLTPQRVGSELAESMEAIKANRTKYYQTPCPFLGAEDECTIYEVRPIECRLHHSLRDTAEPCDTSNPPDSSIAKYNLTPVLVASALITMHEKMADIRDFFTKEGK